MGFSAHTKVLTVDGLRYVKDLTTDDRIFTPSGPSRVTYCGFYPYSGEALNIDQGVVVVGSHMFQSWLNGWLTARPQSEADKMEALGVGSFGRPMIRDDLISCVAHIDFVVLAANVAPQQMWVFGTENGMASVGPYVARTSVLPKGALVSEGGAITGVDGSWEHWNQDYPDVSWIYKDHADIQGVLAFYELCRKNPPPPNMTSKPEGAAILTKQITGIVDTDHYVL